MHGALQPFVQLHGTLGGTKLLGGHSTISSQALYEYPTHFIPLAIMLIEKVL